MRAILKISIMIVIYILPSGALREDGTGVCPKRETTVVMGTETFTTSYASMYETCTLLLFCSTKYRIAYRSTSRTVYRTVENVVLTCCPGYSEVDEECKQKAPITLPPPPTPTTSPSSTSLTTSSLPPSEEQTAGVVSTIVLSTFKVENDSLSLAMPMTMSAIVIFILVVGITTLIVIFFVLKRRKKERFQAAISPLEREGRSNGQSTPVQYYAAIPESLAGTSGVVIGSSLPNPQPTVSKQSTKKKSKLSNALNSTKKDSIGVKMRTDSIGDEKNVSTGLLSEDFPLYADMDNPTEPNPTSTGYIDMRSPNAKTLRGYTYMSQNSEVHSDMNPPKEPIEDVSQSSGCEAYDTLNLAKRSPVEGNCYDKLERSSDLLWGSAVTVNEYDIMDNHEQIGSTNDNDSSRVLQQRDVQGCAESMYNYPQNNSLLGRGIGEHENVKETQYVNSRCDESENIYYNNTGQATEPPNLNDVSIYTNVS